MGSVATDKDANVGSNPWGFDAVETARTLIGIASVRSKAKLAAVGTGRLKNKPL